ncbi:phage antirepressor N-terminal domain-containing protein [Serratia proteamaculans]
MSIATQITTINVPFHGTNLYIVNHNGEPYTPMKPIVDGMGMAWQSQLEKIKTRFPKGITEIVIPSAGGEQSMICLAMRKLSAWLNTISPNKVKPEIREKVTQYQDECDDVLYDYWTKGQAINPRKMKKDLPGKITPEQREAIKQLVLTRGKSVPQQYQAKATITLWSALKTHFGCTYKEITEEQFTEALSLASRIPLEGEVMERESLPPVKEDPLPTNCRILHTYNEFGIIVGAQLAREDEFLTSAQGFAQIARRRGYVMVKAEDFIGLTFK